jgi:thiamine biosynthesis lipoprotein
MIVVAIVTRRRFMILFRVILFSCAIVMLMIACSSRGSANRTLHPPPDPLPQEGRGNHHRHEFSRLMMGVQARIVLFHEDVSVGEEAANAAFDRIAGLDAILSDYRVDSEVNRLCEVFKDGSGEAIPVSDDLFEVLARSVEFSRARGGGAFDVTVGPAVALWREARRSRAIPSRAAIDRAMESVGWEKIELDEINHTVRLTAPGMRLDFGGIGKGYACDEALKVLRAFGCPRAMIEMGGDIALGDPPPGQDGWLIYQGYSRLNGRAFDSEGELDYRIPEVMRETMAMTHLHGVLRLSNCGVGTSGDRFQFVEIDDTRYSHVIDSRTGWAVSDSNAVTVIGVDATTADALATIAGVLGVEEGEAIAVNFGSHIIWSER